MNVSRRSFFGGLMAVAVVCGWSGSASAADWRLGVSLRATSGGGVKVTQVFADSPAEQIGLQPGFLILTVDGNLVNDPYQVRQYIFSVANGIDLVYADGTGFYQVRADFDVVTYSSGKKALKLKSAPVRKQVADPRRRP